MQAASRLLGTEDLARLRTVSDVQMSPDGEWVAYSVARLDAEEDRQKRDLWMVIREDGGEAAIYEDVTGHRPDRLAIDFFDLTWDLADLADFIDVVRAPHRDTEDTQKAFNGLVKCAGVRHRWAAMLD